MTVPTSDGLRDDREALAKAACDAAYSQWVNEMVPWDEMLETERDRWFRVADAVLPVVEAAVTTATEAEVQEWRDASFNHIDIIRRKRLLSERLHRSLVAARGEVAAATQRLDAAMTRNIELRHEVAAARTEGFNAALAEVVASPWLSYRAKEVIAALRLPTQGETK